MVNNHSLPLKNSPFFSMVNFWFFGCFCHGSTGWCGAHSGLWNPHIGSPKNDSPFHISDSMYIYINYIYTYTLLDYIPFIGWLNFHWIRSHSAAPMPGAWGFPWWWWRTGPGLRELGEDLNIYGILWDIYGIYIYISIYIYICIPWPIYLIHIPTQLIC